MCAALKTTSNSDESNSAAFSAISAASPRRFCSNRNWPTKDGINSLYRATKIEYLFTKLSFFSKTFEKANKNLTFLWFLINKVLHRLFLCVSKTDWGGNNSMVRNRLSSQPRPFLHLRVLFLHIIFLIFFSSKGRETQKPQKNMP